MNTEQICRALYLDWKVAHQATTREDQIHRWRYIAVAIDGLILALIYCLDEPLPDEAYKELRSELELLHTIAYDHQYWNLL
jgi:hypothetical protein